MIKPLTLAGMIEITIYSDFMDSQWRTLVSVFVYILINVICFVSLGKTSGKLYYVVVEFKFVLMKTLLSFGKTWFLVPTDF